MADITTIAVNAGIVAVNIIGTSVVGAITKTVCNNKIVKKVKIEDFDGDTEAYGKAYNKAKNKAALISTIITASSAAGMSTAAAFALSEVNSTDNSNNDNADSENTDA